MSSRIYGVKEPKLVDYLLAAVMTVVSISALLVGIWITVVKSWDPAILSLQNFVDAITFRFQNGVSAILAAESILIYGGFLAALALCLKILCSKEWRAIPGVIATAISGCVLALGVAFFANFVELAGFSVFAVALALLMFALAYITKKTIKVAVVMTCYCEDDCCCGDECHCHDEDFEDEDFEDEDYYEEPVKEEPKNANLADDFVFETSNGYSDSYKADFDKYNKQAKEILEDDSKDGALFERKENNYTFEQKLKMADKVAKDYYKDLKKHFEGLGFKSAMTKSGETFIFKNKKYAMIDVAGKKGLKVYFKLDIADYEESPIPVKYKGDVKKYENIPVLLVVKSNLAVKRAKNLMQDVKDKFGV